MTLLIASDLPNETEEVISETISCALTSVEYRGTPIPGQRIDFIVAQSVIIEVKSVARLDPIFQAKLISYLRTTGLRAGLLINFNSMLLKEELQRVVL